MVIVRFYAWIREELGMPEIKIDFEGKLADILRILKDLLGEKAGVIFKDSSLKDDVLLSINNKVISRKKVDLTVKNDDIIDIFPIGIGG